MLHVCQSLYTATASLTEQYQIFSAAKWHCMIGRPSVEMMRLSL